MVQITTRCIEVWKGSCQPDNIYDLRSVICYLTRMGSCQPNSTDKSATPSNSSDRFSSLFLFSNTK